MPDTEEKIEHTNLKAINLPNGVLVEDALKKLKHEKSVAAKYQKRRHDKWNEIYELSRNMVRLNRITQRQAVNIPLMKETLQTVGSRINGEEQAHFSDKGGDMDKEIIQNALWNEASIDMSFNLLDRVDKRQACTYGRSHFSLNIDHTKPIPVTIDVEDIFEFLVDPKTKPWDIDTARYTIKTNIYKPLDELTNSDKYNPEAVKNVKERHSKDSGRSRVNKENLTARNERMQSLGIENIQDLEGYDTIVALDGHITYFYDKQLKKHVRYYCVVADEEDILFADTLKNTIGVDFIPLEGWTPELEITDYWSDGIGDLILVPNKMINTWISQYFENRTLRTFGMNYYDASVDGFTPSTMTPKPWGWYPVPGKPADVFQKVDIPSLDGTIQDIQFIIGIAERASATGALEKGAVEDAKRTLGEIEIAVSNAMKRSNDMAPLYNTCKERLLVKWYKMMVANCTEKEFALYKKQHDGAYSKKLAKGEEWISEDGVTVEIVDKAKFLTNAVDEVQRLRVIQAEYPNNKALRKAIQKRMVRIVDLTPTEIDEIQQEEVENIQQGLVPQVQPQGQPSPINPAQQVLQ